MAGNQTSEGLSSQEAQQRLLEELTTLISKSTTVNWGREFRRNPFNVLCSILVVVAGLLLTVQFAVVAQNRNGATLFQGLFLVFLAAFNICLFGWEVYILRTKKIRHLIVRLKPIIDRPCPWTSTEYPKSPLSTLRGYLTVPAYRDGVLVNVPISLLVNGDIIELDSGMPCPANAKLLESKSSTIGMERIAADEVLPDHFFRDKETEAKKTDRISFLPESKPVRLVVEDAPIIALLKSSILQQRNSASSLLGKETSLKYCVLYMVLLAAVYVISLAVNLIRHFTLMSDFEDSWPDLILSIPIYTSLPLLFLQLPFLWSFTNIYGVARITQLVENGPTCFQVSGVDRIKVFFQTLLVMVKLVFWFSYYADYRVFHVLGTLTSVCAVDKEYLLTGGFPSPERVMFLRTEEVTEEARHETAGKPPLIDGGAGLQGLSPPPYTPEVKFQVTLYPDEGGDSTALSDQHERSQVPESKLVVETPLQENGATTPSRFTSSVSSMQNDTISMRSHFSDSAPFELVTEILNISHATSYSGIAFDDINWKTRMGSLKPIGVNLLATSHLAKIPFLSPSGSCNELQLHLHKSSCSCSLSVEIGVREFFSRNFQSQLLLHSISDPSLDFQRATRRRSTATTFLTHNNSVIHPHVISSVVKEHESGKTLVMSRGSGDLIASCCSDFWDGKDLQPMTITERESIVDYYNSRSLSSYCIALAYSPLPDVNLSLLPGSKIGIYIPPSHFEQTRGDFNTTVAPRSNKTRALTAEMVFNNLQCSQVFLGLVCLQFRPKQDVVSLIEDLYTAGIRFVQFTAENELRGKIFAQKMGLEVDWNCFISLGQPTAEESSLDDDSDDSEVGSHTSSLSSSVLSFFNSTMSNIRAKLPKGIKNIRPHIEMVDNVPLLVSLFTDCTAETITEMIEIMQENSEVVLCIGNAWNHRNMGIFSQADISLSLMPQYLDLPNCKVAAETCTLSTSNSSPNASSIFSPSKTWPSPLELASYLNSASCQLCFGRDNNVSLLSLIAESRRILSSIRMGFLFGLGASLTLSLMLLLSSILFLPPPLTGGHLLWLLIFSIPLLALSLLSSPLDPEMQSLMPNKKKALFSNKWPIVIEFIVLFGSTAIVLLILFGLTLSEICIKDIHNSTCHPLLGDRSEANNSPWNGWKGAAEQGHLFAQDMTAFFTTLYLVIISIRFVHRTQPIVRLWRVTPWQYVAVTSLTLVLQVVYCALSQTIIQFHRTVISGIHSIPVSVWCMGIVWPFLLVIPLEILKYVDKRKLFEAQTLLRLQFGTKLGMHSPV